MAAFARPKPEGKPTVTTKSDFTEDEWSQVVRAPFVAGMAITLADPGGPLEATKEAVATLKSATNPPSREQLLAEVALEIQAMTQQRQSPLGGYRPAADGPPAGVQVLEELRAVHTLVAAKAQPDEARSLRAMAGRRCAGSCRCRQGGWLHGVRRTAGQRPRGGHA